MQHIQLNKGIVALIDDDDLDWIGRFKWHVKEYKAGIKYAAIGIRAGGKMHTVKMHQMILGYEKGKEIDHINGNGLDNRKSNLRFCTHRQNTANRGQATTGRKESSIYKGVSWDLIRKKWLATIGNYYHTEQIGAYATEIEAARAYDIRALEIYGEFAKINGISPDVVPTDASRIPSSKYYGVCWDRQKERWMARYQHKFLGYSYDERIAAEMVQQKIQTGGVLS